MTDNGDRCEHCGVVFEVVWKLSIAALDGPKYCPFCGERILLKADEDSVRDKPCDDGVGREA